MNIFCGYLLCSLLKQKVRKFCFSVVHLSLKILKQGKTVISWMLLYQVAHVKSHQHPIVLSVTVTPVT